VPWEPLDTASSPREFYCIVWIFARPPKAHMWRSTEEHQNLGTFCNFQCSFHISNNINLGLINFITGRNSAGHSVVAIIIHTVTFKVMLYVVYSNHREIVLITCTVNLCPMYVCSMLIYLYLQKPMQVIIYQM
jgi:hypothetical protein